MTDKYTVLPPGVSAAVKKADKKILELGKAKEAEEAGIVAAPPIPSPEPPPEPIIEPTLEPVVEPPVVEPPPEPSPEPTPAPVEDVGTLRAELERTKQALATLQGKYDQEPAELMRQVSFLTQQVGVLQDRIANPPAPPVPPAKKKSLREQMADDPNFAKLRESLAPDVYDAWVASQERVFELASERAAETINTEVGKIDARFARSQEEVFWDSVNTAYPNWKDIRTTPEFQQFVSEVDPIFGVPKYAAIKDAFDRLDSRRVISFLNAYTGKSMVASPTPSPSPTPNPKIAARAAPPRSTGPTPSTAPTDGMTLDKAKSELAALTNTKNRGLWKGTDADYRKRSDELTVTITRLSKAT